MEDEGGLADHLSGVAATDGRWHHITVTWQSSDGQTKLYDNGREVWSVVRGRGKKLPPGGTLVLGREQDCEGGCFDSDVGGVGDVTPSASQQEYGSQDFFGLIDEMRVWRVVRSQEEIQAGMRANLYRKGLPGGPGFDAPGVDPKHPDLVAYWNFDEGAGWTVHDATGRGNNLRATQQPRWEVVRWLSVCGNGMLEGLEECDDGDLDDDDGCDAACKVEPGWQCTRTSPSVCSREGQHPPRIPVDPHIGPGGGGGGASGGGSAAPPPSSATGAGGRGGWVVAAAVLGAVGLAGVAVYAGRERLLDRFPQVERAVHAVATRLPGRRRQYAWAGDLPYDEDGLSDFTALRPPPSRGEYSDLPAAPAPAAPLPGSF